MPDDETLQIPQILREIPPKKFRELIDTLLGGPLQHQTSGSRKEVVENPTEEQLRLPNSELMGGKIMLHHRREKLLFETDWLPPGSVSKFARSVAQVTYLGAASDSWFKHGDGKISCAERWRQLTAQDLVEVNGVLPKEEPDQDEAEAEVEYRTGPGGLVERIVKGPPAGTDRKS